AYRRAERMVGNSDGIAEFISGVIAPKECLLLYNPVDGKLFRPAKVDGFRPDLFGDSDRTTFLFYGSLAFYNDLMLVMRALKRLSEEGKQFRFIFIGDGDARPEMLDFVAKHGLEEQVVFLPFVDKPDLVQYINAADFGCASVKNTPNLKYMLPTKIPEFLACNTYVVGLVHEPLAGILRDRGVAHIAEPGNEDQLVEHLSDLIENGNPLKGDEARACWEDRFSLKPFEQRVLKLVEDVQNQQA
ncbi:MAG: glycosyltransferase, partial [Verrucomicrobiota bacterium]